MHSSPAGTNFAREINEALNKQTQRMEQAVADERTRKAAAAQAQADARKRPLATGTSGEEDSKRQRVEADPNADATALLAAFDFTTLPVALITELIVANLQAFSDEVFQARINAYRRPASTSSIAAPAPVSAAASPVSAAVLENSVTSESTASAKTPPTMPAADRARERALVQGSSAQSDEPSSSSRVKEEPMDPLQMDMDEDIEYEPDTLNLEVYVCLSEPQLIAHDPVCYSWNLCKTTKRSVSALNSTLINSYRWTFKFHRRPFSAKQSERQLSNLLLPEYGKARAISRSDRIMAGAICGCYSLCE